MDGYLQIQNLSYQRGTRQLIQNLSFSIHPGNCLQIVGPNGAGKTTLLQIITGLLQPEIGEVLWRGKSVTQNGIDYHQALHYLSHSLGIKNNLTVSENLALDVRFSASSKAHIADALNQVGLAEFSSQLCSQLSQGQKQKVALAKLLCSDRELWILDEPFSALDTISMDQVQNILRQHTEKGGAVILTTHRPITLASLQFDTLALQ